MRAAVKLPLMQRAIIPLICAGALLTLAGMPLPAAQLSITQLKISGTKNVGKGEILKVINTSPPSFFSFLPGFKLPKFDRSVLNDDMDRIRNLYQSYGYYHVQAEYALNIDERKRTVKIVITINEGLPTRVRNVIINVISKEAAELQAPLGYLVLLRQGEVLRIEYYDRTKELIDRYLGNGGYTTPSINGRVVVDQAQYQADITLDIATGELQFFGPVRIEGNKVVKDHDILREISFKEGARFSRQAISDTQRNIYRLGLFNSVVVTPETGSGTLVPITVRVDERERRTLSLGLGYGNEDKVRAQAAWTRGYLGGEPRSLTASLRYSAILLSGALDLRQRYFIDRNSSLGMHAGYDREYFVSFSDERIVTQVQLGRSFSNTIEGFITYNLEIDRPVSVSEATVAELTNTQPGENYFISGLFLGMRYDTVKGNLYPLNGYMVSLFAEPATYLLGSKVDYLRLIGEGRWYYPVAGENVVATRMHIGMIEPLRNTSVIPLFKRFYSGGSSSVRGYAFQSLGPTDVSGNPIGGDYLLEGNLEVRFPVYGNFRGVLFMDGGNVFSDRFYFSTSALRYSTGLGARYITVVGPVRIDLAFPLDPFPELAWSRYTIYLSLGNAF